MVKEGRVPPKRLARPAAAAAKAAAKAKAAAGGQRARGRGVRPPALRRPAPRGVRRDSQFQQKNFQDVDVRDFAKLGPLRLRVAKYYGRGIGCAGHIVNVKLEGGELMADFRVAGTQDETFLKAMTAKEDRLATLHCCGPGCNHVLTGGTLIHSKS